jgi:hypothetical protein
MNPEYRAVGREWLCRHCRLLGNFFCSRDPIYLQSVIIHTANGGKGEGWHVEEYSVAPLC